jgi:hypothetical protein
MLYLLIAIGVFVLAVGVGLLVKPEKSDEATN